MPMLGIPRRFLNMIVSTGVPGVRSLCRIDLTNHNLFDGPTRSTPIRESAPVVQAPAAHAGGIPMADAAATASVMAPAEFKIPDPTYNFKAQAPCGRWDINFFPLADRKLMCADPYGRAFLFDADAHTLETMPSLHTSKRRPFSLFVPGANSRLYVMDGAPVSEVGNSSNTRVQFEVFTHHKPPALTSGLESWQRQLLPPPPFLRDPRFGRPDCLQIRSHAMLDGGSRICLSEEDAGTYCMDTLSHTWEHVGDWTLPFYGKVEYVPELNLWFGLSAEDQRLAAADLSTMDSQSQPQLMGKWLEFYPPNEWQEWKYAHLVNLGSGRFCIARFYHTGDYEIEEFFVVFTGLEITCSDSDCSSGSDGKNKLGVTVFPSRLHRTMQIDAIF